MDRAKMRESWEETLAKSREYERAQLQKTNPAALKLEEQKKMKFFTHPAFPQLIGKEISERKGASEQNSDCECKGCTEA